MKCAEEKLEPAFCELLEQQGFRHQPGGTIVRIPDGILYIKGLAKEVDGIDSMFTLIEGMFNITRLSDIIRNFIYLPNAKIKLLQQLLAKVIGEIRKVNKVKGVDFTKKMQAIVERYNNRDANDILRCKVYEEMAEALTNLIWDVHHEFKAGDAHGIGP